MVSKINQKSDAEVGFIDEVPVRRADGTVTTLGDIDHTDVAEPSGGAPDAGKPATKNGKGKSAAKPKQSAKAKRNEKESADQKRVGAIRTKGQKQVDEQHEKQQNETKLVRARDAARKAITRAGKSVEKYGDEKYATLRSEVAAAVTLLETALEGSDVPAITFATNALLKAIKDIPVVVRGIKADEKKAADDAKAADKSIKRFLTGDAEQDAQFREFVAESNTKALAVIEPKRIKVDFLGREGVTWTKTGLVLPDDFSPTEWDKALGELLGLEDVSAFSIGDALVFGEAHFKGQYEYAVQKYGIPKQSLKNYKSVATAWPVDQRVEGVSFGAHESTAPLFRKDPALARNLLETARYEKRPIAWIRQHVAEALGAESKRKSVGDLQTERLDYLAKASIEQFEQDLEEIKGDPKGYAKAVREDAVALLRYSQDNEFVPSDFVTRNIARLELRLREVEAENDALRKQIAELGGVVAARTEANARIVNLSDHAGKHEDVSLVGDVDPESVVDENEDFGYLDETDDENDTEE